MSNHILINKMIDIYYLLNKLLNKIFVELDFDYTNFKFSSNVEWIDDTFYYIKSWNIQDIGYKFYNSYDKYIEDYEVYRNTIFDNIIPVLLIQYPEIYKNGFLIHNNSYTSIREVLSNIESNNIPGINIFTFIEVNNIKGQFLGHGEFNINIDTNSYFDIYGIYSKDVLSIISKIFSAQVPFKQTNIYIKDSSSKDIIKLYILYDNYRRISDGSLIFRDKIQFKLRQCNIFSLQEYRYTNQEYDLSSIIDTDPIDDLIDKEVFIINI